MNKISYNPLVLGAFLASWGGIALSAKAELIPNASVFPSDYVVIKEASEAQHSDNYIILYDLDRTSWTITPKYYDLSLKRTNYVYQTGEKTFTYDIKLPFEDVTITAGYTTSDERLNEPEEIPENLLIAEQSADNGGGINLYSTWAGTAKIKNGVFIGNNATNNGGVFLAVYGGLGEGIQNSIFIGNIANKLGGAVYTQGDINGIKDSLFIANEADRGGAIQIQAKSGGEFHPNLGNIEDSAFIGNHVTKYGGAILNAHQGTIDNIVNTLFLCNEAQVGGAIFSWGVIKNIKNSNFINNVANGAQSGAIENEGHIENIVSSNFIANSSAEYGGAIENAEGIIDLISNSNFINNSAKWGAAIGNWSETEEKGRIEKIESSMFIGNNATEQGGAIFIETAVATIGNIKNSTFINNTAGSQGGAIYSPNDVLITSDAGETIFKGNTANGESNAIFIDGADKTLTFDHKNGGSTYLFDDVDGVAGYNVVIKGADKNADKMHLFGDIKNALVTINNVQLNLEDNNVRTYSLNTLKVAGDFDLAVDVDLKAGEMDSFQAENVDAESVGTFDINEFNMISDLDGDLGTEAYVPFITTPAVIGLDFVATGNNAASADFVYSVGYDKESGEFRFVKSDLTPKHKSSVQRAAAVTGATQATVSAVSSQTMGHGGAAVSGINSGDAENLSTWVQAFGSEDDIELKHFAGVVDTQFHGIVGGVDSKRFAYENGVSAIYGINGAYVAGKQKLEGGNKTTQKSGYLGLSAAFRRDAVFGNFALSGGFIENEAESGFGKDKFDTKVVSLAGKVGVDLKDGEWTLTPAINLAYTGIDTDDYTTKAGTKIENKFMNVFTVAPELKVAKDFGTGLEGYAKTAYKMFFFDNSKIRANDVLLPAMSVKPYVEYGIGLKKDWSQEEWNPKDVTSYAEISRHDGGREGWDINLGLKFDF